MPPPVCDGLPLLECLHHDPVTLSGTQATYLCGLLDTFLQKQLTVSHLGPEQVLLGGGEQQTLGIQRADDVIPDRAAFQVVATPAA